MHFNKLWCTEMWPNKTSKIFAFYESEIYLYAKKTTATRVSPNDSKVGVASCSRRKKSRVKFQGDNKFSLISISKCVCVCVCACAYCSVSTQVINQRNLADKSQFQILSTGFSSLLFFFPFCFSKEQCICIHFGNFSALESTSAY